MCCHNVKDFSKLPSKPVEFTAIKTLEKMWHIIEITIKTPERCHCRRSGVCISNFEHKTHLFLELLLLTLNK